MNTPTCENCTHFFQYYILSERRLSRIYYGHCSHSKAKIRRPDRPACPNYAPRASDSEIYVRREYLTKRLLDHVLSLELLPEIPDAPTEVNMDTPHP